MVLPYHIINCGCIIALNLFDILYKYLYFVQFCQIIYHIFEFLHRICHMSQMANLYFPTREVHICQITLHRE